MLLVTYHALNYAGIIGLGLNIANFGGAIASNSSILFEGNSSTVFSNNIGEDAGGVIFSFSYILFEGNSSTVFSNNIAYIVDGGIYSFAIYVLKGILLQCLVIILLSMVKLYGLIALYF